ncbi:MAG: hypothetical protein PHU25_17725 [Deltaproteobacteria bacterium]|nr:hypothetical protein [Deltaproteobacteria bacterium]
MRTLRIAAFALALGLGFCACTSVNSGMPTTPNVTGEAWYVKETGLPFMTFSTSIWYCPAPQGKGPATCTKAIVHEPGAAPAAPAVATPPATPAAPEAATPPAAEAPSTPPAAAPAAVAPNPEPTPAPASAKASSNYKPRK